MSARRGFSIIEITITIGITLTIFGLMSLVTVQFYRNQQLETATTQLVQYMRTAEARALRSEGGNAHGVKISPPTITLFRGSSYATRLTLYDETISFPSLVQVSGLTEINYARQTGLPSTSGIISLTNGLRSETVTLYSSGAVSR